MPVRMRSSLFDLFLINLFRLEDGSPQTLRNLWLGLDLDPLFSDNKRMEIVRVRGPSHFGISIFRERIFIANESSSSELPSRAFCSSVVSPLTLSSRV